MKILLIDNFDSFTYNLVDYFHQLNVTTIVKRNNIELQELESLEFNAIVISPGPGTPKDAGISLEVIKKYYTQIPILGICLGHQAIGQFFGWQLKKAIYPMHGKVSQVFYEPHPLFSQLSNPFNAMRYHSLVIENPIKQSELKAIAYTKENEVMIVIHEQYPIVGFQFHPESILTSKGINLLKNWLGFINK